MRIALVGCGYVADFYLRTLKYHPELELLGVLDSQPERASAVSARYDCARYDTLGALLSDRRLDLVVNLTNPKAHFEVSRACIEHNLSVYSEKPLALDLAAGEALVILARSRGVLLAGAPCNVLGEAAQTAWRVLRSGALGKVRAVYAELDDDAVYLKGYRRWRNSLGVPWPYEDEFEVGVTIEHAGYYLSWLVAFFGPIESITAFSEALVPEKLPEAPPTTAPDFAVAILRFRSGVVARVTCSIVAPENRNLTIIGERKIMSVADCWDYASPVVLKGCPNEPEVYAWFQAHDPANSPALLGDHPREKSLRPKVQQVRAEIAESHTVPPVRDALSTGLPANMDYSRGIAECAAALSERRECRLSGAFLLHVLEATLVLAGAGRTGVSHLMRTDCPPLKPMPWAGA